MGGGGLGVAGVGSWEGWWVGALGGMNYQCLYNFFTSTTIPCTFAFCISNIKCQAIISITINVIFPSGSLGIDIIVSIKLFKCRHHVYYDCQEFINTNEIM